MKADGVLVPFRWGLSPFLAFTKHLQRETHPRKGFDWIKGMPHFVLGEFRRSLDDRFRLSIPGELLTAFADAGTVCMLAKERPGALSLWLAEDWRERLDKEIALVRSKIDAGRLKNRTADVQLLGRLLSTRHKEIQIAGKGRIAIPEGFREFLGVEPGGDVMVVGAGVCVEIWRPAAWIDYLEQEIPQFEQLLDQLAG